MSGRDDAEKAAMERMKALRADGLAFDSIAECLNSEAVPDHEDRGTLADFPAQIKRYMLNLLILQKTNH